MPYEKRTETVTLSWSESRFDLWNSDIFIIPLIDTLTSENPNFITSLLNTKHIFKTILGAFFFGVMIHIVDSLRIARAKKDQD